MDGLLRAILEQDQVVLAFDTGDLYGNHFKLIFAGGPSRARRNVPLLDGVAVALYFTDRRRQFHQQARRSQFLEIQTRRSARMLQVAAGFAMEIEYVEIIVDQYAGRPLAREQHAFGLALRLIISAGASRGGGATISFRRGSAWGRVASTFLLR